MIRMINFVICVRPGGEVSPEYRDQCGPALRHRLNRRGVTTLEFALVAPMVLMVLIGLVDLCIAIFAYNTTAEAARAGARYAVVHGSRATTPVGPAPNNGSVEQVVRSYAPGMISGNLTIASDWIDGDNDPGSRVKVTVTYSYTPTITWVVGFHTFKFKSDSTSYIVH